MRESAGKQAFWRASMRVLLALHSCLRWLYARRLIGDFALEWAGAIFAAHTRIWLRAKRDLEARK